MRGHAQAAFGQLEVGRVGGGGRAARPRGADVLLHLSLVILFVGCSDDAAKCRTRPDFPPINQKQVSINQGIWGNVWFWSGDFMPICVDGTVTAVSREVLVYALTPLDSVVVAARDGGFYSEIRSPLIASTVSGSDGFFQLSLPPGTYSLFVREDSLFYSNLFDGQGNVFPVQVASGQRAQVECDIRYESSW